MNDIILNNKSRTYLFLQLDNNKYMIDSEFVNKIVILQNLERPNVLPKHVLGLLEHEGDFINIIDLRSLLGLEIKPYSISSKIIIIDCDNIKFGLIAESVLDIRRIKPSLIKNAPYSNLEIISQIYTPKNNSSTMIINILAVCELLKKLLDENIFEETNKNLLPDGQKEIEILNERSLSSKQKTELKSYAPIDSYNQYTTFKVDNSRYCIKNVYIKEFFKINKTKITSVPSTPDFIKGIINIKGDYVCVLDIQKYFNRGEVNVDEKSNVIVLNSDKVKLGILTNGISKNMNFEDIEFNSNDYIEHVQDEKIYCILNIENILNNDRIYVK